MVAKLKKIKINKAKVTAREKSKITRRKAKEKIKKIDLETKPEAKTRRIKSRTSADIKTHKPDSRLAKSRETALPKFSVKKGFKDDISVVKKRTGDDIVPSKPKIHKTNVKTKSAGPADKSQAKVIRAKSSAKVKRPVKVPVKARGSVRSKVKAKESPRSKVKVSLKRASVAPVKVKKQSNKSPLKEKKAAKKSKTSETVPILIRQPKVVQKKIQKAVLKKTEPKRRSGKRQPSVTVMKATGGLVKKPVSQIPAEIAVKQPKAVEPNAETQEAVEKVKKQPDHWSDCGLIFYTAGKAFGISSNLRTICIGTEPEMRAFLEEGKAQKRLNYLQKDTLTHIKEIRKIEAIKAIEAVSKAGDKGLGVQVKGKIVRSPTNRKKLARVPSRFKAKSLSRR